MVSAEVCGTSLDTEALEDIDTTTSGTAAHTPIEGLSCVESDVGTLFITHACSDSCVFEIVAPSDCVI